MARYINVDDAVRTAIQMCAKVCVKVMGHGITQFDAVDIADAMENIPTADVAEVKHAKWERYASDWECSNCDFPVNGISPYCPYCGAKMDGGKAE